MLAELSPPRPARAPPPDEPRAASRAAPSAEPSAPAVVVWALLVYAASLPFESSIRILPYDIPTLVGAGFAAVTLLAPRACYGRVPGAMWWFAAYAYVFWVAFARGGGAFPELVDELFMKLLQLLVAFWAAFNLMRRPGVAERALLAFALGCVVLALLHASGVADAPVTLEGGVRRASVLGQNPNRTGRLLGTGLLVLAGLAHARPRRVVSPVLAWPAACALGVAMLRGGSRGAMLAMVAGLMVFALAGRTLGTRLRNAALVLLALGAMGAAAMRSPLMRARIAQAESGNLAKREEIFPTAWGMFRERPLSGWGPIANYYENAARLPTHGTERRDTHNLVLELLTSTGVLGTVPFLVGLAVAAGGAWRARTGPQGMLPAALVAALLVGNMSGNFLWFKVYWLSLSYACAALPAASLPRPRVPS